MYSFVTPIVGGEKYARAMFFSHQQEANKWKHRPASPQFCRFSQDKFSPDAFHSIQATGDLQETVYRLRYKSYIEEGYIEPNLTGLFFDEFDQLSTSQIIFDVFRL